MERLDHESSPALMAIQRIRDPMLREVICRMTSRIPDNRPTVTEVLHLLLSSMDTAMDSETFGEECLMETTPVFPTYFRDHLYGLFLNIHWQGMLPDTRIAILCEVFLI